MAVYKSTYCSPNSTPFDLTDITSTNPFKLYFKVDTSNTKIIGYSVELYDVNQNKIFPVDRDNLITSISPAWVNGENVSIDFIIGKKPTAGDILNNVLSFDSTGVSYYKFNPAGPGGWIPLNSIANGNEYSWKVILYQTDVAEDAPAVLNDSDMVLTTGTMMGSTKERIQSVPTEEVVTDYFLQPVGFDTLNYEPGQEKTWTCDGNVIFSGNRVRIKDYDPTYGYYYLQTGKYGLESINSVVWNDFNLPIIFPAPGGSLSGSVPDANYWAKEQDITFNYTLNGDTYTAGATVSFDSNKTVSWTAKKIDDIGMDMMSVREEYYNLSTVAISSLTSINSLGNNTAKSDGTTIYGFWIKAVNVANNNIFFEGTFNSTYSRCDKFEITAPGIYEIRLYWYFFGSSAPYSFFPNNETVISNYSGIPNTQYCYLKILNDSNHIGISRCLVNDNNAKFGEDNLNITNGRGFIQQVANYYRDSDNNLYLLFGVADIYYQYQCFVTAQMVLVGLVTYQIYKLSNDTSLLSAGDQVDYVIDKEVNMTWVQNASSETRSHWLQQYEVSASDPTNQPFASLGSDYSFPVSQGARVVFNGQAQNEYNGIFVMGGDGYSIVPKDGEATGTRRFSSVRYNNATVYFGSSLVTNVTGATYKYSYIDSSGATQVVERTMTNISQGTSGEWSGSVGAIINTIATQEVIADCTYRTDATVTIEWYRAPDADTWGEIYNKVVHVSNPDSPVFYGQNIQLEQVLSEMSGGAINSTPINYIAELPIEIYPDMDTANNDLRRTTGLVFNNILDSAKNTKTMYIRPFNGIQKNMIWRQTDVNYPLNKYYKITDVNTDYWYVQYTDLYDQQSSTALSVTPDFVIDKTKYEIRSSFLDGDIIPFNFYAKPTIKWDNYIDEAGIITGGKFLYSQQPFLSWKQFQGFVKNGMMEPTANEGDPAVPIRQLSTNVFYSGNTWVQSPNYDLIYRIYQNMVKYKTTQITLNGIVMPAAIAYQSGNTYTLHVRTKQKMTENMVSQTTLNLLVKYNNGNTANIALNAYDGYELSYFKNIEIDNDSMGYTCNIVINPNATVVQINNVKVGFDNFNLTQGGAGKRHYISYSLRFYGNDGGIYDSEFHALPYSSAQNRLQNLTTFEFDCEQCAVKIYLPGMGGGSKFYSYIFKREVGKDNPFELINRIEGETTIPENTFYDYSVANGHTYEYITIIADSYSANYYSYSGLITPRFDYWTLNDFEINDDGTLSIGETWKLRYNADPGAVTQNITKTKFDNLSQYPTYSYGLTNYASGSMSCLLGREVMVATSTGACMGDWYVERLSDSSAFRNLTSNEAISMEKLWRALVHSGHKKLLRDIKGNMWVVQIVSSDVQNQDGYNGSPAMLNFDWEECDLSQEDILKMLSDTSSTTSAVTTFGYVTNTTGTTQVPYLIVAASNPAITYSDVSLSQRSSPETVLNDTNVTEEEPYIPTTTIV